MQMCVAEVLNEIVADVCWGYVEAENGSPVWRPVSDSPSVDAPLDEVCAGREYYVALGPLCQLHQVVALNVTCIFQWPSRMWPCDSFLKAFVESVLQACYSIHPIWSDTFRHINRFIPYGVTLLDIPIVSSHME